MRILHVITSLRTGGAERLLVGLIPRLTKMGHEVDLLIFDGSDTPLKKEAEKAGIEIHSLSRGYIQMWNPLHIGKLRSFIKKGNYDVVHTHNTPAQIMGALACGRNGISLVTTEHNSTNHRRSWSLLRGLDKWMYGKYDRIVCVSDSTRGNLVEYIKHVGDKITVIPNGIDAEQFTDAAEPAGVPDAVGRKVVLMVSAFRLQKDHLTLFNAMKLLPYNYEAWLAGDGVMLNDRVKQVKSMRLTDRVKFLGARDDIPALLKKADVAVLSSHYEGMPVSALEAMSSGTPFIASDVDGLREIVAGAGILFPEGDSEALSREILRVCEDEDYARTVASRCVDRSRQYDIELTARKYLEVYENLRM